MLNEQRLLEEILDEERLVPHFQPIVDLSQLCIYGYEALIRGPVGSPLQSPQRLFETAMEAGRLMELDLLCRRLAIERFMALGLEGQLFLNVTPAALMDHDYREGRTLSLLAQAGLAPGRVVIELTEHLPIADYQALRQAVDHYRQMSFQVAVDDLGAGHSSLRRWAELRPDIVKLDRHFVTGIDSNPDKREFLRSLLDVADNLGCQLIAEGVETEEEQRCLWEMGRNLMLQGYYFARPSEAPIRQLPACSMVAALPKRTPRRSVRAIATPITPVEQELPLLALAEHFRARPELRSVPVVEARRPIAMVRRHEFLTLFTNPFSHSLYARRRVSDVIDSAEILCVSQDTPLEALSKRITDASGQQYEDFVIVDDQGGYVGMGNIIDLLREITTIQVRQARNANPLTGLPGNILINETLVERLSRQQAMVAVYADLDHFKAYNDSYGYAKGDRMILALSRLLLEHLSDAGDFLGHVGGDDFLLLLEGRDWRANCEAILSDFAALVPGFYSREHQEAGGLMGQSRQGDEVFYPLMSLSLAARPIEEGEVLEPARLSTELSELKSHAKRLPGSVLFVDRRQYSSDTRTRCF